MPLHDLLNLAVDDLKAYYMEAMSSQPGRQSLSGKVLSDWFWNETLAGEILFKVRDFCKKSKDPYLRLAGNVLLVPAEQINKKNR